MMTPSRNLEMALVDLTEDLLPGYAAQIQSTNPSELKPIMSHLVAKSLPKPLKDKALAKMFDNLTIILTARLNLPW